jgi:hypothetical protein
MQPEAALASAEFLAADAALAGLDPADLRRVALQDPGRVTERVAEVLAVPAKRRRRAAAGWEVL